MTKIDLITGFLGAGKTTFLRGYAKYLMSCGEHIGIIENDFGAVNVDMMLLADLEGDQCELEMVSGGGDKDTYKRRFKTKLIALGMLGLDRVLIEPSGVFDVDDFFDLLHEEPLERWYCLSNVITLVDANLSEGLSGQAEYLLATQVAEAGAVFITRSDLVSKEQCKKVQEHLKNALVNIKCERNITGIIRNVSLPSLAEDDYAWAEKSGYAQERYEKKCQLAENGFDSLFICDNQPCICEDQPKGDAGEKDILIAKLNEKVEKVMSDEACGRIFRIKGFVRTSEGWLELNATREHIEISDIDNGQQIMIVIGEKLDEDRIREILTL